MKIIIETIPHKNQCYETVGDWYWEEHVDYKDNILHIKVSDLGNEFYEYLIADHELREAMWCFKNNVTQKQVDDFDKKYKGRNEPGDDPKAPYFYGHQLATSIEYLTAVALGIDWKKYEEEIYKL